MPEYADIVIDVSHSRLDRTFQYLIPEELVGSVVEGTAVKVPFGNGSRIIRGYVVSLSDTPAIDPSRIKEIEGADPEAVSADDILIRLAGWIKRHYGGTMIQALHTVMPVKAKSGVRVRKMVSLKALPEDCTGLLEEYEKKHWYAKKRALSSLMEDPVLPYEVLTGKLHVSARTLSVLDKAGVIEINEKTWEEGFKTRAAGGMRPVLSSEQQEIIDTVAGKTISGDPGKYLIHGITGSGKTEVYLGIAEKLDEAGLQTIMLIPEIALTFQTLVRFYRRFGDRVIVLNSSMTPGERYSRIQKAKAGEASVVIGPRSALFTPFPRLGAVIIDEEHETSYKSQSPPRYHTRETAAELCRMRGASLVLGSATPSMEAGYGVQKGEYKLFTMTERLTGGSLPEVSVVDMRSELKSGNMSPFSRLLRERMEETLKDHSQGMLFLNRRGVAGFVSCRACGYVCKCPHCDVSLTQHGESFMRCHYCGYSEKRAPVCPECGSKYLMGFKAGTEKIENLVRELFPKCRTLRMDGDTTSTKGSYEKILQRFADHEADFLIGTQMIVKGHDFPDVTLMGILAADMSLYTGDFRGGERTFDLLTQAAGRAGRGQKAGSVVIQTYSPDSYAIKDAASQDYEAFYRDEIQYRKLLFYPPVGHMLSMLIVSGSRERGAQLSEALAEVSKVDGVSVIGPSPAGISYINDRYRFAIYIKSGDYEKLTDIRDRCEEKTKELEIRDTDVQYDFDPMGTW
ncbi:MAG: primosomal protein N' [Lachnospiraceae bacterium]|nr:primosomal protein N' [Lachnospiraceae bacterium]